MKRLIFLIMSMVIISNNFVFTQDIDTIKTSKGNLYIHFLGHGSLFFEFNNQVIHIDPFSKVADYSKLPKADLVLITHQHGDHLDAEALKYIVTSNTKIIFTEACKQSGKIENPSEVMNNGDKKTINDILIEAVPAYNIVNKRPNGGPFHPKGEGNGYILTFGNKRVYIAGDTENIPEMKDFKNIDIAFIPMNLPYTMTPELATDAAKMVHPKILYPYHFGDTDTNKLLELLKNEKSIDVRIRDMK